jgi:hypothetical protein
LRKTIKISNFIHYLQFQTLKIKSQNFKKPQLKKNLKISKIIHHLQFKTLKIQFLRNPKRINYKRKKERDKEKHTPQLGDSLSHIVANVFLF